MRYILATLAIIGVLVNPAAAHSPTGGPRAWPTEPDQRQETVQKLIAHYSKPHELSQERQARVYRIIRCENRELEPTLQSRIIQADGEREPSFGLAQIHLPSHPTISLEQATDPNFAIRFIVDNVAAGRESMWSCARMVE